MTDHTASRHCDGWDAWAGWEIWYYGSEACLPAEAVDARDPEATLSTPGPTPHLWLVHDDTDATPLSVATLPWPSDATRHSTATWAV